MHVRRALTIAIATPVLLVAVGMAGASAATQRQSTNPQPIAQSEPTGSKVHRDAGKPAGDEMEPEEEGLLDTIAGQLRGDGKSGDAS